MTIETLEAYQSGQPLNVDPGVYPAVVKEVEKVEGEFGLQLRFTFALDGDPDSEAPAWCSYKLGTQTKLWKWFTALKGRAPAIGEKLAPSELVGLRCQVVVGLKQARDGSEVKGVTDLLPAPKAAKAPQPPEDPDACWCKQPIEGYSAEGVPLCAKHFAELAEA